MQVQVDDADKTVQQISLLKTGHFWTKQLVLQLYQMKYMRIIF